MDIVEFFRIIAILLLTIVILCVPTMCLWNWLMPILFNLPTINFVQAAGLLGLTALLLHKV